MRFLLLLLAVVGLAGLDQTQLDAEVRRRQAERAAAEAQARQAAEQAAAQAAADAERAAEEKKRALLESYRRNIAEAEEQRKADAERMAQRAAEEAKAAAEEWQRDQDRRQRENPYDPPAFDAQAAEESAQIRAYSIAAERIAAIKAEQAEREARAQFFAGGALLALMLTIAAISIIRRNPWRAQTAGLAGIAIVALLAGGFLGWESGQKWAPVWIALFAQVILLGIPRARG